MTQGTLLGGRYQVGGLLGYGGMAEVHRGRDQRLSRDVAIKTLRTDLARDETFQMRFRREAQNAAALNHPAIVAVYDTGEERGSAGETLPYIVMEFVNGHTLKEVLTAEGRLTPRRAMEITADICAALEFSHRHAIIHRDIKPGNVMLTRTGQIKVMDFGIARALASGASTMTQTSAVIGTAQYLSPEQARGEPVDARSDVYASGCVLFELLCGHPPFVGDNPVSVAYQHVREEPKPPSYSNPQVPPELDAIVIKALAKNPINRYQSAGEMRTDLLRAVAGRPVSAPPVLSEEQMTAMLPSEQARPMSSTGGRPGQGDRRGGSVAIAVALTVLGVLAVTALGFGIYLQNQQVTVPRVVNLSEADAKSALLAEGLEAVRGTARTSNCQPGVVLAANPPEGSEVRKGAEVTYEYCQPPDKVTVPPLIGLTRKDAVDTLTRSKLVAKVEEVDGPKPADTVLEVDPKPNTTVDPQSTVVVKVSKGNQLTMPDLSGLTVDVARERLSNQGFRGNIRTPLRDTDEPGSVGRVIGQEPAAGKAVQSNASITITIGQAVTPDPPPSSPPPSTSPSPSASAGAGTAALPPLAFRLRGEDLLIRSD